MNGPAERSGGLAAVVPTASPTFTPRSLPSPTPVPIVIVTPVPFPTPQPTPVLTPRANPEPTPIAIANPTPRPTARPTPRPTAKPTAPPAAGPTAPSLDPAATVRRFYDLVEAHRFDEAARLWSARMRAQYPPDRYIDDRFAGTTRIDINHLSTPSMSLSRKTAVVSVDLTEYRTSGPARRWIGSWDLVLGPAGWLMDEPHF
jgi:hypothetical protein